MAQRLRHDTPLDRALKAFNHPLRRRVLIELIRQPASPSALVKLWDEGDSLKVVAYHFGVLKEAKVIELANRRQGVRGAFEQLYRLKSAAFLGAVDWPKCPPSLSAFLEELSASAFLTALRDAAECGELAIEGSLAGWQPVRVDTKGRDEVKAAVTKLLVVVPEIEKRSAKRAAEGDVPLETVLVGGAGFPVAEQWDS